MAEPASNHKRFIWQTDIKIVGSGYTVYSDLNINIQITESKQVFSVFVLEIEV